MSALTFYVLLLASVGLFATAYVQGDKVSWASDKCGCIAVWTLLVSSATLFFCLLLQSHILDSAAGLIGAFAAWMLCKVLRKHHTIKGVFDSTDNSPLNPKERAH
jgi:hypothetical protein